MTGDFWQDKRVLVTGAGGFIASHLIETLCGRGANVRAFVRYNSRGDPGLLTQLDAERCAQIDLVAGDLRDPAAVAQAVRGMQYVFHLGALIAIPYSYLHPHEVVETNMMGTLNVLMAARGGGVERLVHTSTSEVYGTAVRVPIDESHPLQGQSPYAASRIGADKLAESFFATYDLPVVTVRPFNTYGPRQSARAVIPTIVSQVLAGEVVKLGNVSATRDCTFVSDMVAGFLMAAEANGIEGQTFNLGAGKEITVGELAEIIIELIGKPVRIQLEEDRLRPQKAEVLRLLADNSKARQILGWEPGVSLHAGLGRTIDWIRAHASFYQLGKFMR